MDKNIILKERLETVYKNTSVWERDTQKIDFTKIEKHTPGGEIEYVDFTKEPYFEEFKASCQNNYRWFFEQLKNELEREPTFYDYHCLYIKLLNDLSDNIFTHLYNIEKGATYKTFIDVLGNVCDAHDKEELKLELIFNEYTANLDTSVNITTINDFPKNLSDKEKNILNHLADKYFIKRNLTENGLLPLFGKNGTKRLLEEFYKFAPEYKDFQAFNFIKSSIETNLPDATLQNYCREVRKDVVNI